jgi:hypothetical protein
MDTITRGYMIIGFLDSTYFFIVVASYISDVFQYMGRFYMSVFKLAFEFREGEAQARVEAYYLQFHKEFCLDRSTMEFSEICRKYRDFYDASVSYLSITLFCMILVVYGIFNFMSISLQWKRRCFFSMSCCHYLYPILHSAAILVYISLTELYYLTPPTGYPSDFKPSARGGFFLMLFGELVSIISLFLYLFMHYIDKKDSSESEEEIPDDSYTRIVDNPVEKFRKMPQLPVSETYNSSNSSSEEEDKQPKEKSKKISVKSSEEEFKKPKKNPIKVSNKKKEKISIKSQGKKSMKSQGRKSDKSLGKKSSKSQGKKHSKGNSSDSSERDPNPKIIKKKPFQNSDEGSSSKKSSSSSQQSSENSSDEV